jgi:hypothetical protein
MPPPPHAGCTPAAFSSSLCPRVSACSSSVALSPRSPGPSGTRTAAPAATPRAETPWFFWPWLPILPTTRTGCPQIVCFPLLYFKYSIVSTLSKHIWEPAEEELKPVDRGRFRPIGSDPVAGKTRETPGFRLCSPFPPPPRRDNPGNPPRIPLSSAFSVPGRNTLREKSALKQATNPHVGQV